MPLTTLAILKESLGEKAETDDARLSRILDAASAFVERYCARTFLQATYTDEMHDGSGTDTLTLLNFPIISVASVKEFGTALVVGTDPSASPTPDVLIYHAQGQLVRVGARFIKSRRYYSVTYDAGYATIPAGIVQATIDVASIMAKEKGREGMGAITSNQNTVQIARSLPEASQRALDLYRDLALGRAA